ncbi:fibronectin type III domain-containing protein [Eubacterium oxidoreducens]|uniref:GBS Bsp-like repeat-containing protein n=1 Tax=Eubacterium oxidoreducens TaxID=1732 RepID=A0A1G6CQU1_EUBOX|nr:fibronectin type III domain-containing protein [Eubacterium oxidoreducens]SDB35198.1 GBS Bsp-like repeat-containing protein [Eubacterium oxidoreducens]
MKKSLIAKVVSCIVVFTLFVGVLPFTQAQAATVNTSYSSGVTTGTIRYISQNPNGSLFYTKYWPSSSFGNYSSPKSECGTACISMALSYVGINKTPKKILEANNGSTVWSGWGATYNSSSSSSKIATYVKNYLNGDGSYSPPAIQLKKYTSGNGHFMLIIGKVSSDTYKVLDPWDCAIKQITVNGSTLTYTSSLSGKSYTDTFVTIRQFYNAGASIVDNDTTKSTSAASADTTNPTISAVELVKQTSSYYKIKVTLKDNVAVTTKKVSSYTQTNGKDDIATSKKSFTATKTKTITIKVNRSDHGNAYGAYVTNIYAYDAAGNASSVQFKTNLVKRPTIKNVTNGQAGAITVKWSKNSEVSYYQVKYVSGSVSKKVKVSGASVTSKKITGLTKGKTYKVYVRGVVQSGSKKYYSSWSKVSSIKISK